MPDKLKLSIVIPVYNEERYIDAILERVCAVRFQEGVELEYIAVDDHSTDKTWERLQPWEKRGFKIKRHGVNGGKGAALHTGFAMATGDVEDIHDSGDNQADERHEKEAAHAAEVLFGDGAVEREASEHAGRDEERRGDGALRIDHEDAGEGHAVEDAIQDKKECGRREGEAVDGRAENHDQHYFCDEESPYDAHVAKDQRHQGRIVHDEHGR